MMKGGATAAEAENDCSSCNHESRGENRKRLFAKRKTHEDNQKIAFKSAKVE